MTDEEREELIEVMALRMERNQHGLRFDVASDSMLACARVALEVAEPVIREQCAKICEGDFDSEMKGYSAYFMKRCGAYFAAAIREVEKE